MSRGKITSDELQTLLDAAYSCEDNLTDALRNLGFDVEECEPSRYEGPPNELVEFTVRQRLPKLVNSIAEMNPLLRRLMK